MKFAVEVIQLDEGSPNPNKAPEVIYRQVFEDDDFDLKRIVAGVNGISTRKRNVAKPEKKKVREVA